jgi:tetratricopeptide (TPR) repeat protein
VILSSLGEHQRALHALDAAMEMTTFSTRAHLIRARVLDGAGDRAGALRVIEEGRKLEPDDPGLLELQGALQTSLGYPELGLASLDRAIARSPHEFAHMHRANALVSLDQQDNAVVEWTLALNQDPELPRAYLGRARCYVQLRVWDRALADLEQAAAWAHSDLPLQARVLLTYACCLPQRPEHLERWKVLARRTAHQGWSLLMRTATRGAAAR